MGGQPARTTTKAPPCEAPTTTPPTPARSPSATGVTERFWAEHPDLPATPATAIEIWNEPDNSDFWAPAPNPAGYIDLYLGPARRSGPPTRGRGSSSAAFTGAPTFLPQLFAARPDARGQIDGVAVHTVLARAAGRARGDPRRAATLARSAWPTCRCGSPSSGGSRGRATRTSTRRPAKRAALHRGDDVGAGALGLRRRGRGALRLDHPDGATRAPRATGTACAPATAVPRRAAARSPRSSRRPAARPRSPR